jgi:ubiquinone/menaquinone biosynthesis C-methylase UbiE
VAGSLYGDWVGVNPLEGNMGFYQDHLLPRMQDKVMARKVMDEVRARTCAGLTGQVVEVGFGTGLNARYYPHEVTKILAVEPSRVCMQLAESRIARAQAPVELAGLTGEHLDLPTEEFDGVLSTWTLCSIPNLEAALEELRRVLKPGGHLHFVEHGHAPDESVARWQQRIEPVNMKLAGGCHLTRQIDASIRKAGFTIEHLDTYYIQGEPKPFGYTFEGRAVKT